uniref:Uncharacterized protein n=1 Tax=Anguilla anguilla TaxID=7936 RepID=A0A0E9XI83_ANGAN
MQSRSSSNSKSVKNSPKAGQMEVYCGMAT